MMLPFPGKTAAPAIRLALWLLFGFALALESADSRRVSLANLEQDMRLLESEVKALKLEIESLRRENTKLRRRLESETQARGALVTARQLETSLRELRQQLEAADARQKEEIVAEISGQMERLAVQTNDAMQALAQSVEARPGAASAISFSNDYPKDGIAYTVKKGDTLSALAQRYHSSIRDIQNANRIADPAKLRVGQTLFIPQKKE